jgi:hypothetical protein
LPRIRDLHMRIYRMHCFAIMRAFAQVKVLIAGRLYPRVGW